VTPDRNRASFRIVAESRSPEKTDSILDTYKEYIAEWQK